MDLLPLWYFSNQFCHLDLSQNWATFKMNFENMQQQDFLFHFQNDGVKREIIMLFVRETMKLCLLT